MKVWFHCEKCGDQASIETIHSALGALAQGAPQGWTIAHRGEDAQPICGRCARRYHALIDEAQAKFWSEPVVLVPGG